ncbi:hypothetical protein LPW26_24995 [Rhodopseudomonas sp. HC1]|nr:hypothetical protein [Rhodopseudomonas infernalis]
MKLAKSKASTFVIPGRAQREPGIPMFGARQRSQNNSGFRVRSLRERPGMTAATNSARAPSKFHK